MPITEILNLNNEVEEKESIPSLLDPDRKYDGVRSPEDRTRDFTIRNGEIIKKPSKSGGRDNYDRRMSADFKNQKSILDKKDGLIDITDKAPVLSVSEALWDKEDMEENETDWQKFLDIHGHTPDSNDGENVLRELTEEEKNEAKRRAFFGRDRY